MDLYDSAFGSVRYIRHSDVNTTPFDVGRRRQMGKPLPHGPPAALAPLAQRRGCAPSSSGNEASEEDQSASFYTAVATERYPMRFTQIRVEEWQVLAVI